VHGAPSIPEISQHGCNANPGQPRPPRLLGRAHSGRPGGRRGGIRATVTRDGRTFHTALGAHLSVGLPVDVSGPWQWSIAEAEHLKGVTPLEVERVEDPALPKGTQAQLFWFSMDAVGTWTVEFRLHAECENSPVEVRTFHFMVH